MCGIGGCVTAPGTDPDRDALERMADALQHRGPDDRRIDVCGSVGFVHTRLSIVDPSPSGRQPMWDASGRWLLTYNGEIYNHADLRRELRGPFRGGSDTETLVEGLAQWDSAAVSRCNGIFAFAAYDVHGGRLLLARDHLGIKPLYFYESSDALWFASEIRALLAAGVPRRVRRERFAQSILVHDLSPRDTPIAGIDIVRPGTFLEIDVRTRSRRESTWYEAASAVDADRMTELADLNDDQLTDVAAEELQNAVRRQLMSDVPVGVMCSGGLDSSVITALAARESPNVVAYNGAMVGNPGDESPYARRVASSLGIEIRTTPVTVERWRAQLVPAVRAFEYPTPGLIMIGITPIAELARKDGVKVLLTGEGSDELFGGYAFNHWKQSSAILGPRRRAGLAIDYLRSDAGHVIERLRARRRRSLLHPTIAPDGVSPDADARAIQEIVRAAGTRAYADLPPRHRDLAVVMLRDLYFRALPPLLNRQDKNAMSRSVESRVPFLDLEVIRLAQNLPLEQRIGPPPKRLLRRVAARLLPPDIARRPKKLSMHADTSRYIDRAARPGFIGDGRVRDIFEVPRPRWNDLLSRVSPRERAGLWTGEIWCRAFLDDQSDAAIESELWV